ncbi:DgyrCDS13143 [Dimorphilus gyrociliatus]|uniref:Protein cereblon n=1 Tax=Dimorphilus gyrociliatus TaxID=2664684 RepID=A0A7I8W9V1_9ANNE|nr:DgyrCDS13143 [Dimorphilus gyrociliatus]
MAESLENLHNVAQNEEIMEQEEIDVAAVNRAVNNTFLSKYFHLFRLFGGLLRDVFTSLLRIRNQESDEGIEMYNASPEVETREDREIDVHNQQEVHGRVVRIEDEIVEELPLIAMPSIVLIPGNVLPLHLYGRPAECLLKRLREGQGPCSIGVINSRVYEDEETNAHVMELSDIGTTAEIISYQDCSDGRTGIFEVTAKSIGRERFKCLGRRRTVDGTLTAKVKILPEVKFSCPFSSLLPGGYRNLPRNQRKKYLKLGADRTNIPYFLYKQYDVDVLREKIAKELKSWLRVETMPEDPVAFSFWASQNIPVDDQLKLKLLSQHSVVRRLRMIVSIIERWDALLCVHCGEYVTSKDDIFSMSSSGPLAAYVNPNGHVHDTITAMKAENMSLIGKPIYENSWFPGYGWTIAQCKHCGHHLGWRFTTKEKLKPQVFWGLTRGSLEPGLNPRPEDSLRNSEWEPMI